MDFLQLDADVEQQEEKDILGGFRVYDSGIMDFTIKAAYFDKSAGGANSVNLVLENADNGNRFNMTEYITKKTGENFYIDKQSGKKNPMPGYSKMSALAELLTGVPLAQSTVEEKHHNIRNAETKKEVPTPKMTLVDWTGKQIKVGMLKIIENKAVKTEVDGKTTYVDTNDKRETNEINKFFNAEGQTLNEQKAGAAAEFIVEWAKANDGKERNNFKPVEGGPAAGAPLGASTQPLSLDGE